MKIIGGTLLADKTFKKILSIGYEFETHDLAKLSLHQNKKSLINSNLNPRVLGDKLQTKSIKEVDENYFSVKIPMGSNVSKPKDESINEEEMTDEAREFMEEFQEEIEAEKLEKLEKYENDSYLEYFREYRKSDNKKSIKFEITNDLGNVDFNYMLQRECESLTIPKNDMYAFLTKYGKEFDIKFTEELTQDCEAFSGVEFIATYYNPKRDNAHIILDTFVDACSRIVDHLGNLKKIQGTLMMNDNGKHSYTPIGVIEDSRFLYHKPGTNLFYMDTYDNEETLKLKDLGDMEFIPQMTFRCKAYDMIEIFKEMLKGTQDFKRDKTLLAELMDDYNEIVMIETIVDEMFKHHNETHDKKIDMMSTVAKNMRAYVFLILYKIYIYVQNHEKISYKLADDEKKEDPDEKKNMDDDNYLKDFLGFASRHRNDDLYKTIKELLNKHFGIVDVQAFFYKPDILKPLFIPKEVFEDDFEDEFENGDNDSEGEGEGNGNSHSETDEKKEERQAIVEKKTALYLENMEKRKEKEDTMFSALTVDLDKDNANYGNPAVSFLSYIKYFEHPKTKKTSDWLVAAKMDAYSTTFDLKNDEVLIENRMFRYEISLLLRNTMSKKFSKGSIAIKEMHNAVYELYEKIKNMANLEKNPIKKKLSKKCKKGFYRNEKFKCAKQKTRKTKKTGNTRTSLTQKLGNRNKKKDKTEKVRRTREPTGKIEAPTIKSTSNRLDKDSEPKELTSTMDEIIDDASNEKSNSQNKEAETKKNFLERLF